MCNPVSNYLKSDIPRMEEIKFHRLKRLELISKSDKKLEDKPTMKNLWYNNKN